MLKDLTDIRSQLAEGLRAYLTSFVDMTAWQGSNTLPPFVFLPTGFPAVAAPRLYQPPDVVDQRRLDSEMQGRRLKIDESGLFRHGSDERDARVPWATERRKIHRAVVLGRPGEGKTLLTQLTCRHVARVSLAALNGRTRPLSEIPMPLWLKVDNVLAEALLRRPSGRLCLN